ncbi:hypothetical protein ACF0H5_024145 [Mactra antiquata]
MSEDRSPLNFDDILYFLVQNKWIYDFKLTHFFIHKICDEIPKEWLPVLKTVSHEELSGLPFGYLKYDWPESLKNFIRKCLKYSISREQQTLSTQIQDSNHHHAQQRGMSEKKWHEVNHMTSFIDHVTKSSSNNMIVDVGSGLGYLGQHLHTKYGHCVLGLEGKQGHSQGANDRLDKTTDYCNSLQNVTCEIYDNEQSSLEFKQIVHDWFSNFISGDTSYCHHNINQSECRIKNEIKPKDANEEQNVVNATQIISAKSQIKPKDKNELQSEINETQEDKTLSSESSSNAVNQTEKHCVNRSFPIQETSGLHCVEGATKSDHENQIEPNIKIEHQTQNEHDTHTESGTLFKFGTDIEQGSQLESSSVSMDAGTIQTCNRLNGLRVTDTDENKIESDDFNVCMVGLHCCGDLSPTMLKYFLRMEWITSLCLVSCCYHRMNIDECTQSHTNFPMSKKLKKAVTNIKELYPDFKFSPYFLRLGAQETRARWRKQSPTEHTLHMKNVAFRAILEYCLEKNDGMFVLKKTARKLAHKDNFVSFQAYIDATIKHVDLKDRNSVAIHDDLFQQKMFEAYKLFESNFSLIEPFTALQYLLQPVIETLIYNDRLYYLKENGYHGNIVPIFDEVISPRNLVLIASKK